MKIKGDEIGAIISFLENCLVIEDSEYIQDIINDYGTLSHALRSQEFNSILLDRRPIYSIISKCVDKLVGKSEYGDEIFEGEIDLTDKEVRALENFIFCNLIDYIRKDSDVDNLRWVRLILDVNEKCEKEIAKMRENKRREK